MPALLVVAAFFLHPFFKRSDVALVKVENDIEVIYNALNRLKEDTGIMPNNEEKLAILVNASGIKNWRGPYLNNEQLFDQWNRPYSYGIFFIDGKHKEFFLGSSGENKKWDTTEKSILQKKCMGDDIIKFFQW